MSALCPLRSLAHGRAGDKADTSNISIIAHDPAHFDHLVAHVTEEHCAAVFASHNPSRITRYVLPNLAAMNFVFETMLDGGVNRSRSIDRHGKSLSSVLLDSLIPPVGGGET